MELRPFRPTDFETLCEIDCACFPPGISYSRQVMAGFIDNPRSRTWLAQEGSEVAGFLIADYDAERRGHIVTVDVLEKWRRRGIATALMEAAEHWAGQQGANLMYLETAEDNLAAQQFYFARGYAKAEKIEGYYSNGVAAWIMVKELGNESTAQGRKLKEKAAGL